MKKDITYITLPSDLIQWISQKVQTEYQDIKEAEEFVQGLKGLLHSQENALFLEKSEESDGNREYQSGELMINPKSRRVLCRGQEVNLTPKEFDILYFLFQNKGEVFTKEQIYQAVWADEYMMADSNIMAFIRKIRKKIEPNPDAPEYILTIWGVGYKYNERLETVSSFV